MSASRLVYRVRPAAGDTAGALVLFHGRGADEHDLEPLLTALDPAQRLVGVLPRGPLALPPGGAHWYTVREIGYPDPETFLATYTAVAGWLEGLAEEIDVPIERTVLGGFSQGSVMSFALGLGGGRPAPAGIIGLSGFVPTVDGFELELANRNGLPVAIGHGTHDPVIGIEWAHDAKSRLDAAGANLLYRESPIGHSIDPRFVPELRDWLSQI